MVSDDELLDADAKPLTGEPLFRLPSVPGSRLLRRIARVGLAFAAVATVAGAAGVTTHSADLHRAADQERNRSLLRLVGGGVAMTMSDEQSSSQGTSAQLEISIRNDGVQPQVVTRVDLDAPGVEVVSRPAPVVIQPGKTVPIGLSVSVSCLRPDLVERPRSVVLHVQPNAAPGAPATSPAAPSASPTDPSVAIAATGDSPSADPSAPKSAADPTGTPSTVTLPVSGSSGSSAGEFGFSQTGSFYWLCGGTELLDYSPVAGYVGLTSRASRTNPVVGFQIGVQSDGVHSGALATEKPYQSLPGLTVTGDLPAPATTLTTDVVQAGITVRVTDCAALGATLNADNGVRNLFEVVASDLPLASEPTDPRFRRPGLDRPLMLTGNVSAFEQDLLVNLVAACPGLK